MKRQVLLVVNPTREEARSGALSLATQLQAREIAVFQALSTEGEQIAGIPVRESSTAINDFELVIVLGGDGTILRSAEMVRSSDVPLLGVNLGHVGFLAEIEKNSLDEIADQVAAKNFTVESRMVLSFAHHRGGKVISTGWALNDLVIEKQSPRMIEVFLEIDGRPLSKWGCDGVLCATPTGSTAYAFSAGGPVVWPEVAALVLLPLSAHALFAKPMVVSPNSKIQITLLSEEALLTADGFRSEEVKFGDSISITKDLATVNLARLGIAPFADRLVAKFKLPVEGWRGGVKKGLRELNIRGLGVIEDATLNLEPGFTVITGETGAGKTMVVTALSLLMGGRADVSAIRHGSDKASLSARLIPNERAADLAQELGGDIEDEELLITRTLSRDGKNRAVLGGAPTTLSALSDLGEELIALHAQSSTFRLLKGSRQREIIDLFGGDELSKELIKYQKLFKEYRLIISEIEKILSLNLARESEIKRINEFLVLFNKVKPIPNEVKSLRERADQLENVDSFTTGLQQANLSLGEDESSALVQISQAKRAIEGIPANSKEIDDLKIEINQLQILVNELTRSISSQLDSLESNPQELETINLRRSELSALFRKFAVDQYEDPAAELVSRADADAKLLAQLQDGDGAVAKLEKRKAIISEDLGKSANKLTVLRKVVAEKLSIESSNEIKALAMPNAKLIIEISPTSSELSVLFAGELLPCGSFGSDDATFLLVPHPGAPALPIQKGASGGELSRVMLAIELVLAQAGSVPTYLFDEVDAGVGGKAAVEVGRRLALLARHAQVLVVTHLPQVAAWADQHFAILKSSTESVTSSDIKLLSSAERVSEIARMMTGLSDSSSAQEHAGELLDLVKMEKGRAQVR